MKSRKSCLVVLFAFLLVAGCGGAYVNPNYSFEEQASPKLAIAPVLPQEDLLASFVDSFFVVIFEDTTKSDLLVPPAHVREVMGDDKTIAGILSVMQGTDFTKEELKGDVSIANKTSADKLSSMRSSLGDADLLLIPRGWSVTSAAGYTMGACTFRLYDMRTGQMIYEKDHDLNVNVSGTIGKQLISGHLIGFVYDYYMSSIE